jgi:hypothetical protein
VRGAFVQAFGVENAVEADDLGLAAVPKHDGVEEGTRVVCPAP